MENHQFQCVNPLQMTIFNSHVKLPEGIWFMNPWFPQLTLFTPGIWPPKPSWRCRQCPSSCRSLVGIYLRGVPSMGIPKSWMVYNGKAYEKPMKSLWEWMVSQGTRIHGSLFFDGTVFRIQLGTKSSPFECISDTVPSDKVKFGTIAQVPTLDLIIWASFNDLSHEGNQGIGMFSMIFSQLAMWGYTGYRPIEIFGQTLEYHMVLPAYPIPIPVNWLKTYP